MEDYNLARVRTYAAGHRLKGESLTEEERKAALLSLVEGLWSQGLIESVVMPIRGEKALILVVHASRPEDVDRET